MVVPGMRALPRGEKVIRHERARCAPCAGSAADRYAAAGRNSASPLRARYNRGH